MKISELITKLQNAKKEFDDINTKIGSHGFNDKIIELIRIYEKENK